MRLKTLLVTAFLTASAAAAHSHESWLSPEHYLVNSGDTIAANIRVGEKFSGSAHAYLPNRIARMSVIAGGVETPVEARVGDRPAIAVIAQKPGLTILVHETTEYKLTYTDPQKFLNFVAHKDFPGLPQAHEDRGLPPKGFQESYRRFVKSLIAVDGGEGTDRVVGLETEIVALLNPYTDDLSDGMPVRVLYEDAPKANAQVEVFDRAPDGGVSVAIYTTDGDGRAVIAVQPGHEYLVDSVVLRSTGNDDFNAGPVWESLWAALTFAVPAP